MISNKFRVWSIEHQKMLYSNESVPGAENYSKFLMTLDGEILRVFCHKTRQTKYGYDWYDMPWDAKEYVVMRFTGRIDRKGKEVYEGDIVGVQSSMTDDVICLVEWDENRSGFYMPDAGWLYFPPGIEMEVVGDIYQNPNMIKKHA